MTTAAPTPRAPLSRINKTGLILAFLLGLNDATALIVPAGPPGQPGQPGPPFAILVLATILGLVTMVCVVIAWRTGRRGPIRLAAGARILNLISTLPAFFAGVPAWLEALVAITALVTVATVAMMLLPARRPAPITD